MKKFLFLYLFSLNAFSQNLDLSENYNYTQDSCSYNIICYGNVNYLKGFDFFKSNNKMEITERKNAYNALGLYNYARVEDSLASINQKLLFDFNQKVSDTIALDSILNKVQNKGVLILNENHTRIETRVFNYNILHILKKHKFTHLAMEALYSVENQGYVSFKNGYYFVEPIQAEILRKARELGFQIVKYDTNIQNASERDSLQAYNLYKHILNNENIKMAVIAGHSHGADDCEICPPLMGKVLKEMYHIDPITIDQTRGIDFSNCFDLNFKGEIKNCFVKSDFVKEKIGFGMFDYFYIHPNYSNVREWYLKMYDKKIFYVESKIKNPTLIQVYYKNEFEKDLGKSCSPIENITKLKNGMLELFLRPKNEYVIVYRDKRNKIIEKYYLKTKL